MKGINREILNIAIPAIIANITIPLLGLFDTAIAGHAGPASYIGAIAVGAMVFNLVYWNFGFLRMGTSGLTAQAYGRKNRREQTLILYQSTYLALLIAISIVALQSIILSVALWIIAPSPSVIDLAGTYYRIVVWGAPPALMMMAIKGWLLGMQNSVYSMRISIAVNVINIFASSIFVFGLGMGFAGIATGTLVAEWSGLAIAIGMIRHRYKTELTSLSLSEKTNLRRAGRYFATNANIFIRSFVMMLVHLFFLSVGARSGDIVLAVNALMMQLFTLYSYFMDGVAFAGEALVGKYYGAHNWSKLRLCIRQLFAFGSVVMLCFVLAYGIFPTQVFGLLTNQSTVISVALEYRWWAVVIPIAGMAAFVLDGVFIGLTLMRGMLIGVLASALSYFALYFLLAPHWHNHALWLAFVAFLGLRGLVQGIILHRQYNRKPI